MVAVWMITYNHEPYIARAIESVLMQQTTFPVKVFIGEDFSPDKTRTICATLASQHPDKIVLLPREKNIGPTANALEVYSACFSSGAKYIAFLEGDDYWTDPDKLQKQVDFLEQNEDFSLTSHEAYLQQWNFGKTFRGALSVILQNWRVNGALHAAKIVSLFFFNRKEFWQSRRPYAHHARFDSSDLKKTLETIYDKKYIPTLSIVARLSVISTMPFSAFQFSAGHQIIIIWSAMHGKLKHFNKIMGVKVTQPGSVSITKVLGKHTLDEKIARQVQLYRLFQSLSSSEQFRIFENGISSLQQRLTSAK